MQRRALLRAVGAGAATALAGCNTRFGSDDAAGTNTDHQSPAFTTADAADRERGQPERFDPAHLVVVRNEDDTAHRIRVTVRERRRDLSMYTWTSTLEPGYDDPIYDVEDAEPAGVQSYEIGIESAVYDEDRAASTVLWSNQCHGDATLSVTADGGLEAAVDTC